MFETGPCVRPLCRRVLQCGYLEPASSASLANGSRDLHRYRVFVSVPFDSLGLLSIMSFYTPLLVLVSCVWPGRARVMQCASTAALQDTAWEVTTETACAGCGCMHTHVESTSTHTSSTVTGPRSPVKICRDAAVGPPLLPLGRFMENDQVHRA